MYSTRRLILRAYSLSRFQVCLHVREFSVCECLFIDESMKRDHVLITSLNLWTLNHLIVDLPFLLVLEIVPFSSTQFRSMLFTNWMKSYRYRREMNRHWSVSIHLDTNQKTIKDNLRRTSFDWWSILLNLIDHFYSWWNQWSSFEICLIFDSDFYLFISLSSLSRSPRTNLISRRSILLNLVQSNSCRFAVRANLILASR